MQARTKSSEFVKFNDRSKKNPVRAVQILPRIFTESVSAKYYRL